MRQFLAALIVTTASLLPAIAAEPETLPPPIGVSFDIWALQGLRSFYVETPVLNDDAKTCGVTADGLETELKFIMGQSAMTPTQTMQADAWVRVGVVSLSTCVFFLDLRVNAIVAIAGTKHGLMSSIWNNGIISQGPDARKRSSDVIGELAKHLVNDWNAANPPR